MLTSSVDADFKVFVEKVKAGKVKEIATKSVPGSGLEPPVSTPIKPDNTDYIQALSRDEKTIFDLYVNISEDEDEAEAGDARAFDFPGFVPAYIRPLFCKGIGPFRWVALSGDPEDIYRTDRREIGRAHV